MSWTDAARLSLGTLSVLPAGMPSRVDRTVGGRAMALAPMVGALVGGIAAAVVVLAQLVNPDADLLAAVLGVLVVAQDCPAACISTGSPTSPTRSAAGGTARRCCGS